MRLLTQIVDPNELIQIRILFESKGIPIFISNEDSARNFGLIYPARKYGIFVVYEDQYSDAAKLLKDETHVVSNPVDMDEYRTHLQQQYSKTSEKLFNTVMSISVIVLLLFIGLITYMELTH